MFLANKVDFGSFSLFTPHNPKTHQTLIAGLSSLVSECCVCFLRSTKFPLRFGENSGPVIDKVKASINEWGVGIPAARGDCGDTIVHRELEREVRWRG